MPYFYPFFIIKTIRFLFGNEQFFIMARKSRDSAATPHPAFGHPLPEGEGNGIPSPFGRRIG
jgi:hypothetical protein